MLKKSGNVCWILLAVFCIIYPTIILRAGLLNYQFSNDGYHEMLIEIAVWFLLAIVGVCVSNMIWLLFILFLFSYYHRMLLPMLAAAAYIILTYGIGKYTVGLINRRKEKIEAFLYFFCGVMELTICYAIMSWLKIGSIPKLLIFDGIVAIVLCILYIRKREQRSFSLKEILIKGRMDKKQYIKIALILPFLCLAIGRANVSLDYDSVWYGLRSAFTLSQSTGIYEDLKLVGCVYTYPKGFETYMLPLSGFESYGFMYAGNIILAILLLYVGYKTCLLFLDKSKALWGSILLAAVPGVMNMSITAKPDILTLLIQLIGIYYVFLYFRYRQEYACGMVIATYIYAQSLKPTATIFSTTILLVFVFASIVYHIKPKFGKYSVAVTSIACIDLFMIWLRTYLLTGIPATSLWGNIFRAVGMKDKYPYASGQISQFRAGNLFDSVVIRDTLTRIKEFMLGPNSSDTDHIIIAWGTTLCTFLAIGVITSMVVNWKSIWKKLKQSAEVCGLLLLFLGEFTGCIFCLWVLSKPDGNYFMLYYTTTILIATIYIMGGIIERKESNSKLLIGVFCFFLIQNIFLTGAVNWAWSCSFVSGDWINRGFYNHRKEFKSMMNKRGCVEIYEKMCEKPENKVLGFGIHPEVERFPCVIESELDVSFWGNNILMSDIGNFIEFMNYEEYDYIYIEPGYLQPGNEKYQYLCELFDYNMIKDIYYENGYILLGMGENEDNSVIKSEFENLFQQDS